MEKYNYIEAVKADISAYLKDHDTKLTEQNFEKLYEAMWICDQVTGNASGSYTFNSWKAEENLAHNWDLLKEVCEQFDIDFDISRGAEYYDVTIRCYLLNDCMLEIMGGEEW